MVPLILKILRGGKLMFVKQFAPNEQITLGRAADCGVVLESESVSALHALIENRGESQYFISDLGSNSGLKINGQRALEQKVENGDQITIGEYTVEFYIGLPKSKPVEAVAPVVTAPPPPPKPVTPPLKSASAAKSVAKAMTTQTLSGPEPKTKMSKTSQTDLFDIIKPSRGSVAELMLVWGNRIVSVYHTNQGVITVGSTPDCNVLLPPMGFSFSKATVVRCDRGMAALPPPGAQVFVIKKVSQDQVDRKQISASGEIALMPDEMIQMVLGNDISLIARQTADTPKPIPAPLFDLSSTEATGAILSIALTAIFALYAYLYGPRTGIDLLELEEPIRTAMIITAPTPVPPPPPPVREAAKPTPPPTPEPTPPPVKVKATPEPKKVEDKGVKQKQAVSLTAKVDPGVAANAAPNKNLKGPRVQTSVKQGGAIKTATKEGAQQKTVNQDPTKSGVFSVFGSGGAQDKLGETTTGAGALAGMANQASGTSGSAVNRPGQGLGSDIKDIGRGGTGSAAVGINGGLATAGRGSGNSGYGTGGIGGKVGVRVVPGGAEESFSGTIDREAIRRVIQANLRVIRSCYEKELNRNPDLSGKIVLEWVIVAEGKVMGQPRAVNNDLGNARVADCIGSNLRTWRFPEPPGNQEVTVMYPFVFSN